MPLNSSLWEVCGRFRDTGFSASRHSVGGYLRSAEIGCPRKSHPSRHLQRSVSSRIDNLPERDAGLRDFALIPELPLEFPGCPALHGAQRARTSEFWNSPMGDEPFGVAGPTQTSSKCWNPARYPPIEFWHITRLLHGCDSIPTGNRAPFLSESNFPEERR